MNIAIISKHFDPGNPAEFTLPVWYFEISEINAQLILANPHVANLETGSVSINICNNVYNDTVFEAFESAWHVYKDVPLDKWFVAMIQEEIITYLGNDYDIDDIVNISISGTLKLEFSANKLTNSSNTLCNRRESKSYHSPTTKCEYVQSIHLKPV